MVGVKAAGFLALALLALAATTAEGEG